MSNMNDNMAVADEIKRFCWWETAGGEGGIEPPERANAQRFSRPPLSTTQPPLRTELLNKQDRPSAQAPIALVMLQVGVRIL